jgi:hypothetical protein
MQEFVPLGVPSITWFVFIDDRDDDQGRLFRARVKEGFSTYLHDLVTGETRDGHDPDQWFALNLRMAVVHPSAIGWIGPDEDPALRWREVGLVPAASALARRRFDQRCGSGPMERQGQRKPENQPFMQGEWGGERKGRNDEWLESTPN